jgi:hypothetical protein
VWGSEKPRVTVQQGRYCVNFLDILDNVVSPRTQRLNRDWEHDEIFYWSPDLPELIIKQAHVIKQFFKTTTVNELDFASEKPKSNLGTIMHNGVTKYLTSHGLHKVIYGINNFHNVKPSSTFLSERDRWFLKAPNHLVSATNYINGLGKMANLVPTYWVNDSFKKGLKAQLSKPYYLE